MRLVTVLALAWCAALAFGAWVLYTHGHPVWAVALPLIGLTAIEIKERE